MISCSRKGITALLGGCLLLLSAAGCSYLQRVEAVKVCQFKLEKITLRSYNPLRPRYFYLDVELSIKNPHKEEALLERFLWKLYLDDRNVAHGELKKALSLPPKTTKTLVLKIRGDTSALVRSALAILSSGSSKYRMEATVFLDAFLFDYEYDVKITEGDWTPYEL